MSLSDAINPRILQKNRIKTLENPEFKANVDKEVDRLHEKYPTKNRKSIELLLLSKAH